MPGTPQISLHILKKIFFPLAALAMVFASCVSSPGIVVIDVTDFTMDFHPDENFNQYYLKPFTGENAENVMSIIRKECSRPVSGELKI